MPHVYARPVDGRGFGASDDDLGTVVESAQQHHRDAHGRTPERGAVEANVVGPG